MESRLQEDMKSYEALKIPGYINTYVYQMDADSHEYYMVVIFQDKESYIKNAEDPAQDTRPRVLELP